MGCMSSSGNGEDTTHLTDRDGTEKAITTTKSVGSTDTAPPTLLEMKSDSSESVVQAITVRVIQAKGLPVMDASGSSDPYVKVKIGDRTIETGNIKNSTNPVWNRDIIVKDRNLFATVNSIEFEVYDYDTITKDDFIGSFGIHFSEALHEMESPPLWYPIKKNGDTFGECQVQIQCTRDVNVVSTRNYTHVLQITIKGGHDLHDMDWISGTSDPYCRVEWGSQIFKTSVVGNSTNPAWNQSLFLFVDKTTQSNYQLRISVLDEDLHCDDHIGTGYVSANNFFETKESDGKWEGLVMLQEKIVNLDKGLDDIPVSPVDGRPSDPKVHTCGQIAVSSRLIKRKTIEKDFYEHLCTYFDVNNDGKLDREEVRQMLIYLEIPTNINDFMQKFDANYDEVLDKDEVLTMLQDFKFQDSDDSSKFILYHLRHDPDHNPFTAKLMEGFFREDLIAPTASPSIQIINRKTGLIVQEHIPGYISFALQLMYDTVGGKLLANTTYVQSILKKMSVDKGREYDNPNSTNQIKEFIQTHSLDTSILLKQLHEFKTFNDFFARSIDHEKYRPMIKDSNIIVSPADCRMMVFKSILDSTNFWIKGDKFTVQELLGPRKSQASIYEGGAFCIARLAPQDYHRWHWPVSGKVTKITHIPGALYTVNPIAVNKNVNVYTENTRAIIEVDTTNHGKMAMFCIAAAMVGSMSLFQKGHTPLDEGMDIERGDVSGEFRFGGSTILLLFEAGKVEWKEDIERTSADKYETLIEVRDSIGGLPGKTNISALIKSISDGAD